MANKIDSSKLLPSSKTSAIVPYQKLSIKSSSAIVKVDKKKDLNEVGGKLSKIEKILGSELVLSRKKQEVKRKEEIGRAHV